MFLPVVLLRLWKVPVFELRRTALGCARCWMVVGLAGAPALWAQTGLARAVGTDRAGAVGSTPFHARQAMHQEEAWLVVASHLPDPKTANGDKLEVAGDVLRARRYPEDALDFYTDALQRGGDQARLLNKMGVTEIGLRHADRARAYLKMALKRDKRDADAWNNLGAAEYLEGRMAASIDAYRKAIKLKPGVSLFHGNLATALVEKKDFEGARKELGKALEIDPEFGSKHDSEAGIAAHVLSSEDRARYCFEMARAYASRGMIEAMLHSLAMAAENGIDLRDKMGDDAKLRPFVTDERVVMLMHNAKAMGGKPSMAALAGSMTPLPGSTSAPTAQ